MTINEGRVFFQFQSAPPPLGGGDGVCGRSSRRSRCFNPRPPRLEGATRLFSRNTRYPSVSIRAPPAWRGRLLGPANQLITERFQSAPPPLGGGDRKGWLRRVGVGFQSAPPPLGGGDRQAASRLHLTTRFNPRPPRLEGATDAE